MLLAPTDGKTGRPATNRQIDHPATDDWPFGMPMPKDRLNLAVAVVGGAMYAIGGTPALRT